MTFLQLLEKANRGYPDGWLARYYDAKTEKPKPGKGDTLAEFVVLELAETFDPDATDEEQVREAVWVLQRARGDLTDTIAALLAK